MSLTDDTSNLFVNINNKDNAIIEFLATGKYENLSEDACRDIFHIHSIATSDENRLNLCKLLIENNQYIDLAVTEFTDVIVKHPQLTEYSNLSNIIDDILNRIVLSKLSDNALRRIIDCLEMLYAMGNHRYTDKITLLYRRMDSDIKSKQHLPEVIHAKLAILAYTANKYNSVDNLQKMYELYQNIKKSRMSSMKGTVYYYHGIFYQRTDTQELYIPLKKVYYNNLSEGCFQKSQSYGFWLTDYII